MSGIQGIDRLFRRVGRLATDLKQTEKPLKAAGVLILGSIEKNFQAGGRPARWQKLAPNTKRRRGKKSSAKILVDTGRLKNSHSMKLTTAGVLVGTNVVYAKRHHFGYPGGSGRGRSKTPARPFLMLQEEDIDNIGKIFKRHISR